MRPEGSDVRSLEGTCIVTVRAETTSDTLRELLEARGAEVLDLEVFSVERAPDLSSLHEALRDVGRYAAILFGSKNAVEVVASEAERMSVRIDVPLVGVGPKTAASFSSTAAKREIFVGPVWTPEVFRAEGVLALLGEKWPEMSGLRLLWPRGEKGRATLLDGLSARGARVDAISVYHLKTRPCLLAPYDERWSRASAILFMSGETMRGFLEVVPEELRTGLLAEKLVGVIGPVAAGVAHELGLRVDFVAPEATSEGLVEGLERALEGVMAKGERAR